ncbi:MAG: helicase-related protein [Candidatus Woesearchaeota archaeon]
MTDKTECNKDDSLKTNELDTEVFGSNDSVKKLSPKYADPSITIALDTLRIKKQALFFVNTKPSAEKLAEEISKKMQDVDLSELAIEVEKALSKPTKQCKRLAGCIRRGVAFHHAGLASKQRELIEQNFKKGIVKIICATPTLAIGVDLPAFRSVIRDLKRYGGRWGMQDIPVLEYQQMAGRAGRPSYDAWGEAITIAKNEVDVDDIEMLYVNAGPESIYSKLAVEPVLRTYLLSLIAVGFVRSRSEIISFFSKTFWAHQYKDMMKLESIIDRMLLLLEEWEFIISSSKRVTGDFVSADELGNSENNSYTPTRLGKRVAELYLDPFTAHELITAMHKSSERRLVLFSVLHMISHTLEMRPLLSVRTKEYDIIQHALAVYNDALLHPEPSGYEDDYDDFLASIKTSLFMQEWCDEMDEDYLLEKYNIRPGEVRAKLDIADWLLYACIELSRIISLQDFTKHLLKARTRLKYGVKEELLPLLRLKGIGRVRARALYRSGFKDLGSIRRVDLGSLTHIIGKAHAQSIKEQLGQEEPEPVSAKKRVGQMGLGKYG